MRENPGNEEFFKMKDTDKLWFVSRPIPIPDDYNEFSLDKKTIYCPADYYNNNLPPDVKEALIKEDPHAIIQVVGWENASPELLAAFQARTDELGDWEDDEDDEE